MNNKAKNLILYIIIAGLIAGSLAFYAYLWKESGRKIENMEKSVKSQKMPENAIQPKKPKNYPIWDGKG